MTRPSAGTDERHVRESLSPVLRAVCEHAGLDPDGAVLVRFVNNAVFRLASAPVVVRIATVPALRHRAHTAAAVARWFAEHDVPAVRLLAGVEQPWSTSCPEGSEHVATLWDEVPEDGRAPTGRDLAELLLRVHALPEPPAGVPRWQPIEAARTRLADARARGSEFVDDADLEYLERRYDELEAALTRIEWALPPGLIHGDAHLGNVIVGPSGPVLCDLDMACVGPREWDLTPLAVGRLRFGFPARDHAGLAAGYGVDVTRWAHFPVLRELRELKTTTGALSIIDSNPAARAEFAHRLRTLRQGDRSARWRPYH